MGGNILLLIDKNQHLELQVFTILNPNHLQK